jgi:hypothetical protein
VAELTVGGQGSTIADKLSLLFIATQQAAIAAKQFKVLKCEQIILHTCEKVTNCQESKEMERQNNRNEK